MGYQQILRLSDLQIFTTTSVVFQPSPNGTFCVGWRVSVWHLWNFDQMEEYVLHGSPARCFSCMRSFLAAQESVLMEQTVHKRSFLVRGTCRGYGHGGFWLNCLNSWLDKFGSEPRVYMSLPFTMYCPTMAPYFPVFFSEVKATKPILPWMIIIGFQEAKWCCTSQRKSACGYSPASHTCIT